MGSTGRLCTSPMILSPRDGQGEPESQVGTGQRMASARHSSGLSGAGDKGQQWRTGRDHPARVTKWQSDMTDAPRQRYGALRRPLTTLPLFGVGILPANVPHTTPVACRHNPWADARDQGQARAPRAHKILPPLRLVVDFPLRFFLNGKQTPARSLPPGLLPAPPRQVPPS
jgi:hypothetical protein